MKFPDDYVGKVFKVSGEHPKPYPKPYDHGLCEFMEFWPVENSTFGFRVVPVGMDKGYIYPGYDRVESLFGGIKIIYSNDFGHEAFVNLVGPVYNQEDKNENRPSSV